MTTEKQFQQFLTELCKGNAEAIQFLTIMTDLAHFFDDLVDGDKPITEALVHGAMWRCLVILPQNTFYRQFHNQLHPLVANAIIDWRVANRLERNKEATPVDRQISFIIRSSYVCLLQQTALLVGGPEWAEVMGIIIRRMTHAEGFDVYVKRLEGEHHGTV